MLSGVKNLSKSLPIPRLVANHSNLILKFLIKVTFADPRAGFISLPLFCHPERAQRPKGLSKSPSHSKADRAGITRLLSQILLPVQGHDSHPATKLIHKKS